MEINNNIEKIKSLWDKKKDSYIIDIKAKKNIDIAWNYYKDKITKDDLKLEDYANRIENVSDESKPYGGYLMNFLERTSSKVYGSSKPGTAFGYGIKFNEDKTTYTINKRRGEKQKAIENADKNNANDVFNKEIKDWLKKLLLNDQEKPTSIEEKIKIVEVDRNPIITASQLIRKIVVLEHQTELLTIYHNETINELYDILIVNGSANTNLAKNKEIVAYLKTIFNNNQDWDDISILKLESFLWSLINAKTIFDETSKNVILYGAPGTGKTWKVQQALETLTLGDSNFQETVQFHPSYTYEDFIEGIKPNGITENGNIKFELVNGTFKQFCIKALQNPEKDFYFIIDEINRANLSNVFGELLYCIEYRYPVKNLPIGFDKNKSIIGLIRTQYASLIEQLDISKQEKLSFKIINKKVYFGIPDNVYVIGMMNDVDKSIDAFDLALRRRFKWIPLICDYNVIEDNISYTEEIITKYLKACKSLNEYISGEKGLNLGNSFEFGHSYFMNISKIATKNTIDKKHIEQLFNDYLKSTLKEYLRSSYSENEIEGLNGKLANALERFVSNFIEEE